jgi:hypothetical protein
MELPHQGFEVYSRISALRTLGSGAFRLLAVTPIGRETIADDEQYLAEHRSGSTELANSSLMLLEFAERRPWRCWTARDEYLKPG